MVKDPNVITVQEAIEQLYKDAEKKKNMDKPQRTYYNRCRLLFATLATSKNGQHKMLKLKFDPPPTRDGTSDAKWINLFLNEQNNERNRETLQRLGLRAVPETCSYHELEKADFDGLGDNLVDLVALGIWNKDSSS